MTDSIDNFFVERSLYYSVNKFNKLMKEKYENNLVIIHFNIRSLPKNKLKIENFLTEMIVLPEVIAITKTKLNNKNKHLTTLDHYEFIHVDSQSQAGGVGFYMRKDLKFNIEKQLSLDLPDCESLFVKIKESSAITEGKKNTLIGVIYRHPHNNVKKFNEHFSKSLTLLNQMNTNCYLCGDYNNDLLGAGKKAYVDEYLNSLYAKGFCFLINKPTRYSRTRATILDHIY